MNENCSFVLELKQLKIKTHKTPGIIATETMVLNMIKTENKATKKNEETKKKNI